MLGSILMVTSDRIQISINPKKTEAITKTLLPMMVTHVRFFLGACECTHIPRFATASEPYYKSHLKERPFHLD